MPTHPPIRTIKKVLIANRAEIACRIIRACRQMGIATTAVFSDADARALHVRMADAAAHIGPAPARQSYLCGPRIIEAALAEGCDAIHPGYGFLAENAGFADAVIAAGLVWIGPPASAMRAMGSKPAGRANAIAAGVPVPAAVAADDSNSAEIAAMIANEAALRYPLLVKAVAGGGGRGMRLVRGAHELAEALDSASREALNAFGDARVFIEQFIENPHHVEIQILADAHGTVMHLGERECSVQRRHQKIIEESPSPLLTPDLRARMGEAAVRIARNVGYASAGTIEFLVNDKREFYFLEMNARLQVEHPVTEMISGIDLVRAQIELAQGATLESVLARNQTIGGHAIECRICAEDPAQGFMPSIGRLTRVIEPRGARVDTGFATGDEITRHYDSLIAKFIAHAPSRAQAIQKMRAALADAVIEGVTTNLAFLRDVLAHDAFARGETTTGFVEQFFAGWSEDPSARSGQAEQWVNPWRVRNRFRLGREPLSIAPQAHPAPASLAPAAQPKTKSQAAHADSKIDAPMPGLVQRMLVAVGDEVKRGAKLAVMEAMKMELRITAPRDGRVKAVHARAGDVVEKGAQLVELEDMA